MGEVGPMASTQRRVPPDLEEGIETEGVGTKTDEIGGAAVAMVIWGVGLED